MDNHHQIGVKEIAKKANVSIATVDRVLHNRPGVSVETKKKIEGIIKKYNYQPNILARRLASRKRLLFATLMPKATGDAEYWNAPLKGIIEAETQLNQFGISIEKYFYNLNNKNTFSNQAKKILQTKVDGILVAPSFVEESKKFLQEVEEKNIPYVFINSDIPNQNNLCYIGPDLYAAGYLCAQLVNFIIKDNQKVLILNISKVPDSLYHVWRKEEGFRAFYEKADKNIKILKEDIAETSYSSIKTTLDNVFKKEKVNVVFVTNSRVFYVARYFEEKNIKDVLLIGFDFVEQNIDYLEKNVIDFLICQKPQEQAFRGVMSLYNKIVKEEDIDKTHFMSIDILTKENYKYYSD